MMMSGCATSLRYASLAASLVLKTVLESPYLRMNCQKFPWRLSSGKRKGRKIKAML